MKSMLIRELNEADQTAFLRYRKAFRMETKFFDPYMMREGSTYYFTEGETWFGMFDNAKMIGALRIAVNSGVYFIGYGILQFYQGHGYGKIGVRFLLDYCKNKGLKMVKACVVPQNWKSLLLLYSQGFKVETEQEGEIILAHYETG